MTFILGVNAFHGDASACLLRDGHLVAAAEEERFRRIKHWAGFPSQAIAYCLREAGIGVEAVEHLALNSDPRASLLRKIGFALRQRPELGLVLDRLRNQRKRASVESLLAEGLGGQPFRGRVHRVEHHLAHLASCFYVSPFDEAVVLSVDGFGDFSSAAWGVGRDGTLGLDGRVYFPHSLGIFYQALTQYLGFPHYGDEYKVMGLAPYGRPRYLEPLRQVVQLQEDGGFRLGLEFFRHHREQIDYEWTGGTPEVGRLFSPALEALLGPARDPKAPLEDRHRDIAHSVQVLYEEAFFHLLGRLHERYRLPHLALAGGCGMNSVANGKIFRRSPFRRAYVQSAPGDAGGAIGAALVVARDLAPTRHRQHMSHAYWGPQFTPGDYQALLETRTAELQAQGCVITHCPEEPVLWAHTARAIMAGQVVGWFQGRMEWGPRALGNRSILCDPRRADMKDILNLKIKRRESFRPFAPAILREAVIDWFEEDDDVPFMMQVFQIREAKRPLVPAVTHVDGSGRLQTVERSTNPRFHGLIAAFQGLTGVPMLLNTSFNENEPVVCRPEEALDCFLRTRMDRLVLGDWLIQRS